MMIPLHVLHRLSLWWDKFNVLILAHYCDDIMGTMASQITSLTNVYSTVYSDADQRKHQSSASLAFVWGIHRGPVNSPHKWSVTRKMFPFDDVIMRNGRRDVSVWWDMYCISCNICKYFIVLVFDGFILSGLGGSLYKIIVFSGTVKPREMRAISDCRPLISTEMDKPLYSRQWWDVVAYIHSLRTVS